MTLILPLACVDPEDLTLKGTVDIVVVDATITNLAEPQIIRLNRSRADRLTGRFGTAPITKAMVEVVVDSSQRIACHETIEGSYQLPADFKGQLGHAYQLRFTLLDGSQYQSTQQVMTDVTPIAQVKATFNATSLPASEALHGYFRAGHDLAVDWQDPVEQHNYYRWDWNEYEQQGWCRTCQQGVYVVYAILPHVYKNFSYVEGDSLYEDCFIPVQTNDVYQPPIHTEPFRYDYVCRTQCWEILHSYAINVFDDRQSNGGLQVGRLVAHIPYYTHEPCLIEIRQSSLTPDAYRYYKLFEDQTQNTGGLADTPPTALGGNVHLVGKPEQTVAGYFTASAVSSWRYWLDRKDGQGLPLGATDPAGPAGLPGAELYYALNQREPVPEPTYPPPKVSIYGPPSRPPTAVCVMSESRTPYKPVGWRN